MHRDNFPTFRKFMRSVFSDTKIMLVVSIIVFALGVLASYIVASTAADRQAAQFENVTDNAHDDFTNHIQNRIASYQALLQGGAGLLTLKNRDDLTAASWRHYVRILQSEQSIDDLQGIGFAELIDEGDLASYQRKMEREHGFEITLRPDDSRSVYTSISYLEPLDSDNRRAIGYDMFTDPLRREAMANARDSGTTSLSAPVVSVQDLTKDRPPKTILAYFPVYNTTMPPTSVEQRRQTLEGYAYLLFRTGDMVANYRTSSSQGQSHLMIVDVTEDQPITVYEGEDYDDQDPNIISKTIDVGERKWRVSLYLDGTERSSMLGTVGIFASGLLISGLVASSLYLLLRHRNKVLEEAHEQELNQARNDLLALASHQLRTPATGTRQYIGMLIEGFFGALNDEQVSVAQRAYDANERQLEIVDEILYVAKAESGQIFLDRAEFDIAILMRDIVANSHDHAAKKNISVKFISKRKKVPITADAKYITMSLENLLSNSIKYSYPDSTVTVRLIVTKDDTVKISFIDHGVGIDDESLMHLFDKFARFDNPLSSTEGGTGLGLYLADKLIRSHGGEINVETRVGEGSTFTITLPFTDNRGQNVVQLTDYR